MSGSPAGCHRWCGLQMVPAEGSSNYFFVVDHCELVVQLVAPGEAWGAEVSLLQWV